MGVSVNWGSHFGSYEYEGSCYLGDLCSWKLPYLGKGIDKRMPEVLDEENQDSCRSRKFRNPGYRHQEGIRLQPRLPNVVRDFLSRVPHSWGLWSFGAMTEEGPRGFH